MNKNLLNIIGILLLSMVAFSFTACSEDNEDTLKDLEPEKVSRLVGEWVTFTDRDIDQKYIFNADGTGMGVEMAGREEDEYDIWEFEYTFNEETGLLIMYYIDDSEVEVSSIKFVNDDTFLEYSVNDDWEIDDDDPRIYHRKKKGIYSNSQNC